MHALIVAVILLLALASDAVLAHGQLLRLPPASVEIRAGGAVATGEFARARPGIGAGTAGVVAGDLTVFPIAGVGLFGGLSRARFSCVGCRDMGLEAGVLEKGARVGVEIALPAQARRVSPYGRAGLLFHQIAFDGYQSRLASDISQGLEVSVGLTAPVVPRFALAPAVGYRRYTTRLPLGGTTDRTTTVSYLVADFGLRLRLP